MAKQRERDADVLRYPQYAKSFEGAFRALYDYGVKMGRKGVIKFGSGERMWRWWISGLSFAKFEKIEKDNFEEAI